LSGDLRDRTVVYDGAKIVIYSPTTMSYARTSAPDNVSKLIDNLLDAGVEMPMVDVLYQTGAGTLTERGARRSAGWRLGDRRIRLRSPGVPSGRRSTGSCGCRRRQAAAAQARDHDALRRSGDPQYQAVLRWNLSPKIDASTFTFAPPKDAKEIPFSNPAAINGAAP
jgi:hypothetical protein